MTNTTSTATTTRTLSATHDRAVLARLASDDALRARLAEDPVGTLRELGIAADPSSLPAAVALPAPGELREIAAAGGLEEEMGTLKWAGLIGDASPTH